MLSRRIFILIIAVHCAAISLLDASMLVAQDATSNGQSALETVTEAPAADPDLAKKLRSPRETLRTLLEGKQDDAVECLDLSEYTVTEETRMHAGSLLAFKLRHVILRMVSSAKS